MSHSIGKKSKKSDKVKEKIGKPEVIHGEEIKKHKSKGTIEGK